MKIIYLIFNTLLISLLLTNSFAEEKTLKFRGKNSSENFKPVEISVSPDLLKKEKATKFKKEYKIAKEFALETDQNLQKKKKVKFRGSAQNIYNNYASSVVFLYNPTEGKESLGSGFLVDKSGIILTNWHVTNGAEGIFVWTLPNNGAVEEEVLFKDINPYQGLVLAENKQQDLALIKVSGLPKNIKPVELGNNSDVEIGQTVYAIGHPNGLPWSFTLGTVSQIRKNKKWAYEDKTNHSATVIQTQTPISPGNSGGPLFADSGKIIGINTWGAEGQNLNFAVAVDHAKEFIKANPNIKNVTPINALIKKKYPNVKTQDHNENGIIDTWFIDENKNGKIDLGLIDDDENGIIEGTLFDLDENGVWELFTLDTDDNGKVNLAYLDENEDGEPDVLAYDYDEDGKWDKYEKLT